MLTCNADIYLLNKLEFATLSMLDQLKNIIEVQVGFLAVLKHDRSNVWEQCRKLAAIANIMS